MRNAMKRASKLANVNAAKSTKKTKISKILPAPKPLVSLGTLHQGTILRRPSKHNKSPYVADVKLDDEGEEVIAHTPMLDLGGLITPGTVVRMTKSKPGGKTSHAVQLVRVDEVECGENGTTWVGAHPGLGNAVAKALLEQGHLNEPILGDAASDISSIQSEVTIHSKDGSETVRSDFVVNDEVVVEVKSCVCADYKDQDTAPEVTKKDRYVTVISSDGENYQRTALFPIGKRAQKFQGQKVVSERSIKHLRHLAKIANAADQEDKYKAACLLMIVNRGDCHKFRACKEACPVFADELEVAIDAGVNVVAAGVAWDGNGDCMFRGLLPVVTNR